MDARRVIALASCGALWLGGCAALHQPAAHGPAAAPDQPDPPQVVQSPESPPAGATLAAQDEIVAYAQRAIQRLDEVHADVRRAGATEPAPHSEDADSPAAVATQGPTATEKPATAGAPRPDANSAKAGPAAQASVAGDAPRQAAATRTPPTIVNVAVRALGAPPGPTTDGLSGSTAASNSTRDLIEALRTRIATQPGDASWRAQLDERLLRVLAGEYEQARAPFEAVPAEQARVAAGFIETLISLREAHGGDLPGESSRLLERIDGLRDSLIPISDLALPKVALCRAVVGFGLYDPIEPPRFPARAGGEFVAYCEIRHLTSRRLENGEHETHFDVTISILTAEGRTIQEQTIPDVRTRWRDARHECFIAPLVTLPPALSPGDYVAKITVADRIGSKVAQKRASFQVASGT
jgi:hypothetical protein